MRLLYPNDPEDATASDGPWLAESAAARAAGFTVSVFSFEEFERGTFVARPALQENDVVLYRGWMLPVPGYEQLTTALGATATRALTSVDQYRLCHHLPEWYPLLSDSTAETIILPADANFPAALADRAWPGYFIKDYVKSLNTSGGSLVSSPEHIANIVSLMKKYRGVVEGGVCVRRREEYEPASERRYFVFNGRAFSADDVVPAVVAECASRIHSPFFSVDVARRSDGVLRVIELGDGQVSDRKEWPVDKFVRMLAQAA